MFQLSFITCILSLRGLIDSSIQLANYQEIEHCTIPDMFTDSEGHHRARGGQMTSLVGLTHKDRQQFMLIFTHIWPVHLTRCMSVDCERKLEFNYKTNYISVFRKLIALLCLSENYGSLSTNNNFQTDTKCLFELIELFHLPC